MVHQLRLRLLTRTGAIALAALLASGLSILTDANSASASMVPASNAVTGESWSAPAYPVTCLQSENQVSCSPENPADVKAQSCYLGVLLNGDRVTVCTTFEEHGDALRTSGGKVTLVAYGCTIGDLGCLSFEAAGRGMAIATTGMMFAVSDAMRFDTSSTLWVAAVSEWSFWNWAVLIVVFVAMVWAVTAAAMSGDRSEVLSALVRTFIAIPAVALTLWVTGVLLNSVDDLTWYVMNREGPFELFATLQKVMWAGGSAHYFFGFLIHLLVMVSMLLLMLVFAFRNIVLAALIMVGPVAWMIFPVKGIGPQWVVRYVSAVVVLLLTGPLTIGFVTLIINGLAKVKTIWDPQSWPLLIGLVLVAFAPFAIFGLFSFVGAVAADSISSGAASHAGRIARSGAGAAIAIPTRLGASPAGAASRGRRAARPGGSPAPGRPGSAGPIGGATTPAGSRTGPGGAPTRAPAPTSTASGSGSPAPSSAPRPSGRPATGGAPRGAVGRGGSTS